MGEDVDDASGSYSYFYLTLFTITSVLHSARGMEINLSDVFNQYKQMFYFISESLI